MTLYLFNERCVACEGGVPPLTRTEAEALCSAVPGWILSTESTHISRTYTFKDFAEALAFVNTVGAIAEGDGHHPDIHLTSWNKVRIDLSTHAIRGLSRNDFIVAAKIDARES
jgi:4a-hydroxytetrahydrobiopterin dehydratase